MSLPWRIEKLRRDHAVEGFCCGQEPLDRYLSRFALQGQMANASTTYVALVEDAVIGFHTLTVGEVAHAFAAERMARGLARHPIPIMLLARLAVAQGWQGRGVASALLLDAVQRTLQAADIVGIRALVVHAKDETARRFYAHFDFQPSPTDPLHLFLLIKDLRAWAKPG